MVLLSIAPVVEQALNSFRLVPVAVVFRPSVLHGGPETIQPAEESGTMRLSELLLVQPDRVAGLAGRGDESPGD